MRPDRHNEADPARSGARSGVASARTCRAFTLVELMTVMVLIGVLTAMILPEMRGTFEGALLRATARELVNAFELASSRAISLNQQLRVQIDSSGGRYRIERLAHHGARANFVPLKDVLGAEGKLDQRIAIQVYHTGSESEITPGRAGTSFAEPDSSISFFPDGTAEESRVLLKDRAGFRFGLRINPVTARVNTLELQHE